MKHELTDRATAHVTTHHNGRAIRFESSVSVLKSLSMPLAIMLLDPFQAPEAVGCVELPITLLTLRGL